MISRDNWHKKNILKLTVVLVTALLLASFGTYALLSQHKDKKPPANATNSLEAVAPSDITYPSTWEEASEIPVGGKKAGVISQASRGNPDIAVSVRKLDEALASNFDIKKLPGQVVAELKSNIEGFSLKQQSIVRIGSHDTVRIVYTTSDEDEITNTMYIIPLASKTYYITYSSMQSISGITSDISKINLSVLNL